MEANLKQ